MAVQVEQIDGPFDRSSVSSVFSGDDDNRVSSKAVRDLSCQTGKSAPPPGGWSFVKGFIPKMDCSLLDPCMEDYVDPGPSDTLGSQGIFEDCMTRESNTCLTVPCQGFDQVVVQKRNVSRTLNIETMWRNRQKAFNAGVGLAKDEERSRIAGGGAAGGGATLSPDSGSGKPGGDRYVGSLDRDYAFVEQESVPDEVCSV
mmetsp:Transcript_19137/g.41710  ORF Transcript_19137/g.41710 Transcript_19137/m.41710 type:complete len:199 (-) Transcript_19137:62-658(-)